MIFGNKKTDLGTVAPIANDFDALVSEILAYPVPLPFTKGEYLAFEKEERNRKKRCGYFTACSFTTSERKTGNAATVELIALDIDDADDALHILVEGVQSLLPAYGAAAYHTATSTPDKPRLRVIVRAVDVAVEDYPKAVAFLADQLGVKVTPESQRVVQPMFFPVRFREDTDDPILYTAQGEPISGRKLVGFSPVNTTAKISEDLDSGIEFIRAPLSGVTVDEVREMLDHIDPACDRKIWIEVGAAIKHQFAEDGFELWCEWSERSAKYPGEEEITTQWRSLRVNASGNRASVTLRSLITRAKMGGYEQASASKVILRSLRAQLASMKETDTLLHQGMAAIAAESGNLLLSEVNTVVLLLGKLLRERGHAASTTLLTKDIARMAKRMAREDTLLGKKPETAATEVPGWARGVCYVSGADEFFKRATGEKWKPTALDSCFGVHFVPQGSEDLTPSIRPRDFLLNKVQCPRVAGYLYDPREELPIITRDKRRYINLYHPTYPNPDPTTEERAGAIFQEHLKRLIRELAYREIVVDWLAWCVQNPGQKINWAILLQGAPGCGKSALGNLMGKVLGRENILMLDPETLTQGSWNDWMSGRQIIFLEEVRLVGESRFGVMNKLKPAIANEGLSINRRWTDVHMIDNVTNYFLLTNHHDSIMIDDDDRRYFIVESTFQTKNQVLELPRGYFSELFNTDAGGLRSWFLNYKISENFDAKGQAPITHYRGDLIDLGRSSVSAEISEIIESSENGFVSKLILSSTALATHLMAAGIKAARPTISAVLRDMHFVVRFERIRINGVNHTIWTRDAATDWTSEQITDHFNSLS